MTIRALSLLLAAVLAAGCASSSAQDARSSEWKPAAGPLMTRWAKDVSPRNALPEYPRPQMVRKDWQNLNGLWDYAIRPKAEAAPTLFDGKILVPYPIESALSGVMKKVTPDDRLWYHRTFRVPSQWDGRRILLHFGAVDWDATVYVNGKEIGNHKGGYDGFSFDITAALLKGDNKLVVAVTDPTSAGSQPRGKQILNPHGIWYTPTTGIWQTVWMEPVSPQVAIGDLIITPDLDTSSVKVDVTLDARTRAAYRTLVEVLDGDKVIASGESGKAIRIDSAKAWSPDAPHLYNLRVSVGIDPARNPIDRVESYFGLRKVSLGKDDKGITRILLNNKFVFQVGPLDQGFWPDGLYTAPTDEALRYDIEITRKLGFNMARKHVKIEPARWYYWCDKLGLLVWQDMPSAGAGKDATNAREGVPSSPEAAAQFEKELAAMINGRRNHPSIIMWVPFNEGWGQYETARIVDLVRKLDPTRLVNGASGWHDRPGVGDVHDIHAYPGPAAPPAEEKRAIVLGEFGGLGLPLEGHTWVSKGNWGYRNLSSAKRLTQDYGKLLKRAHELKDNPGLSAIVYTQTTDVEVEVNGLLTYDRAVIKPDLETVARANQGVAFPEISIKTLVPTSQQKGITWRYTTEKPADDWFKTDFNDASWKQGPGGFGTQGTPGAVIGTQWNTSDIWIRREFQMPGFDPATVALLLHHDEDAEVYINGVLAARVRNFTTDYEEVELTREGRAALKEGRNIMAIHCRQTTGGQYIDAGIVEVK